MEMDSKQLFHQLMRDLTLSESLEEKESILFWVMEHTLNLSKTEVLAGKKVHVDESELSGILRRLNQHEPAQYVLGEAEFYGRKFFVNSSVLIPRPETELLVKEVLDYLLGSKGNATVLDIGTGSGCIATTLALECPSATVAATDISEAALTVARNNAEQLNAKVNFMTHDIVKDELTLGLFDVVVSNPPYIPLHEKSSLQKNVKDYEPAGALFVPDSNPLLFHEAIAKKTRHVLKPGGLLITEIHEQLGDPTTLIFQSSGFIHVKIIKDLSGKNRFVSGIVK